MPDPAISPTQLQKALKLNIIGGCMGVTWYVVCAPGTILNVFIKNELNATPFQLGLLTAVTQIAALFSLAAILFYRLLPTRKPFWLVTHITHRLLAFTLAGAAIYASRGGDAQLAIRLIIAATALSFILTQCSGSGWWSWMADLIPEKARATFFGRRSAFINAANMVSFFGATVLIDTFSEHKFAAYAAIFTLMTVLGTLDIIMFLWVPEPPPQKAEGRLTFAEFLEPMRQRNFRGLCLSVGLFGLSVSVAAPFIAPAITDPRGIGAPMTWLGIMAVLTQFTWIVTAPYWGMLMDRFGRKPAVVLGALFPFTWLLFLFLTPKNYVILLPIQALAAGAIVSGWNDGVNQLMLTLTPEKNRTAYVAWYMALAGVIAGGGSIMGGLIGKGLGEIRYDVGPFANLGAFHVVLGTSLALCALSVLILMRIHEGKTRPVGFVLARLASPGILRTMASLNTLANSADADTIARSLRQMESGSSELLVDDIIGRLNDPDLDVRTEAAHALGRLHSLEAVDALIAQLGTPGNPLRIDVARALGKIGDPHAIPHLIQTLETTRSEELQVACIHALGRIGGKESTNHLFNLMRQPVDERLLVSGAEAISKLGTLEAAWEILPRMHTTANPVLRRQLAIAMGNTLGDVGDFYRFVIGGEQKQSTDVARLIKEAEDNMEEILGKNGFSPQLRLIRENLDDGKPTDALHELRRLYRQFVMQVAMPQNPAPTVTDELLLDTAILRNSRLGVGFWTLLEIFSYLEKTPDMDQELLRLDVLLLLYFLARFQPAKV